MFKEDHTGQPNPQYVALTTEQQAHEDAKPAYWATWTRTEAELQLRASAWERDASRYGPWASGNTQHPLTKEQVAAMVLRPEQAEAAVLNQPEPAPAPRRRTKSDDRDRA